MVRIAPPPPTRRSRKWAGSPYLRTTLSRREPMPTASPTNLELAALVIRTWDIYNPRELAYAMTRMHTILTGILPGSDATVARVRDRIGMSNLVVDGLALPEFVAIAFALFAYGSALGNEDANRVVLEPA